jgi:NAD(P)-dependent dehydrogenase (short-subunit alcohol dehydrogenase family)
VVTGAASGIGAAIAASLGARGWSVAGLDLHAPDTDIAYSVDVSDTAAVAAAVQKAEAAWGAIDAVVSAAGHYESLPIAETPVEAWHRMLAVHLGGLVNTSRAALPGMVARGRGAVVAITSELAIGGGDADAHYSAAKGALIGLVRSLAAEVAPLGVRVNAVAPGPTDTPLLASASPWRDRAYLDTLPARRLARPEEIAEVVRFLLEEGTFCVGEVISPNSGAVI